MLPLLCEPEQLLTALEQGATDQLLVVALVTEDRFLDLHLPGAIHVHPAETQSGPPTPGKLPHEQQLNALVQRIGLQEHLHLVVYDDEGGGWAGRFIWLLDEIGHTRYSYINGGLLAWSAAGYPCASGPVHRAPSTMTVTANRQHTIELEALQQAVADGNIQIWDARSPEEYRGERLAAARAGHIPGAVNYEWTRAMDTARDLRLRPLTTLKAELGKIGLNGELPVITHCQSHHRSGLSYLIGKLLGFSDIKAYAGSWSEWGNHPDTAIETSDS